MSKTNFIREMQHDTYGWYLYLDEKLLHQKIKVHIETDHEPGKMPESPYKQEVEFAEYLIENVDEIISKVKKAYEKYETDIETRKFAIDPMIILSRWSREEDGDDTWNFSISRSDWPAFDYCMEFRNLELLETYAGD